MLNASPCCFDILNKNAVAIKGKYIAKILIQYCSFIFELPFFFQELLNLLVKHKVWSAYRPKS